MKRFLLFAVIATLFAACTQDIVVDVTNPTIADNTPETLVVGFEGDDTRIQLNDAQKTVWTSGDLVSVFYRSDANQKWQYTGETGARTAELKRVDAGTASHDMDRVVIVYPYNEGYYINPSTYNVQASLPAVQTYLEDSYGLNGNIMISQGEYNQFSLKSVCGWLKLQLTGDGEKVKSITLRGNNGEQVAGELYINSADATSILASDSGASDDDSEAGGSLIFEDTILTEVTLNCGEGVKLGKEATAFYIALPPQTFANGFTVEIECEDYELMTLTTEKELVIERNHIQPMASVEHNAKQTIPNNEIWYTTITNSKASIGTNANEVSHEYKDGKGVIVYDADVTTLVVHDYAVETISIPSTITKWDQLRFYGFNLKKLIGDNVSDDGRCLIVNGELLMFASKGLTEYTFPNNITKIGNESCSMAYSVSKFVIPEGVTVIGEGAFSERYDVDNSPILTVELPSTLQTIGSYAFYNAKIETINIPSSVNYIGHHAFADRNNYINLLSTTPCEIGGKICGDNSIINVPESNWKSYVYSDDWCEIAHLVRINGEVPNYDSIPCFQLWYTSTNGELVDFDISKELFGSTSIISNVYQNGRGVITCAGPIREICQAAFFYEAHLFKTITLPSSIRTIGRGAFVYHDNNLTDVYCNIATPPTGGEEMFYNNNGNIGNIITIYVPATSIDAYKNASYWKEYNIVGYNFETGEVVEGYGIDDSNLDHNKYLTYVANHSHLLDFEREYYCYWDTYFQHNVNGIMVAEYKFQLAATQNYTIQYISDDYIYIEGNELYVYSESYYNHYDERERRYNTIDLTTIGIQPTDLIVLRVDAANNVVTINDQEISFNKIGAAMSSQYIFSAYDSVSDEGHAYYYDGMIDGAKLYYAKGWDSNGYLTYLGYASTDINDKTGNVEACWRAKYYNGEIVETTTFANDRYVEDYVPLGMGNM